MQSMIRIDIADDVAEIVIDAPQKLNALDRAALADLAGAYAAAEEAGVRALLLRGEGRGFCAGRDIADVDPDTDDVLGYLGDLEALMRRIATFPAPTFAAVQGACLGVGLGLALVTDVVYVADTAKLGSPFAGLGALLDSGAHALFVERLGTHRTLDLVFTGELMSGTDAVAAGLFSRVVAADELLDFTRERVTRVAAGATQSFIASKRIVAGMRDATLWPVVGQETAGQEALRSTHDYREGFAAFRERRPPRFSGS